MELLVIIAVIYAVHRAIEDSKSALRKSRDAYGLSAAERFPKASKSRRVASAARHDAGFWIGQAAQGFPAARHGLAAGWHAGRQAQAEGRAAREKAKADHLETRVQLIPEIRAHVQRQREALEQLRAEREAQEGAREGATPQSVMAPPPRAAAASDAPAAEVAICPGEGREGAGEGSPAAPAPEAAAGDGEPEGDGRTWTYGPEGNPLGWPAEDDPGLAHRGAQYWGTKEKPWVVTEFPPGGGPGKTVATYADGELQAPPGGAIPALAAPAVASTGGGEGTAAPETEPPASPTQGEPAMAGTAADTTYTEQLGVLTRIRDDAEEELTRVRAKRMLNHLDTLTGLGLDAQTLSDAAAIDDALKKQEDAAREALEASDTARNGLMRRHGGIQEAVDSSSVAVPAEPAFYSS